MNDRIRIIIDIYQPRNPNHIVYNTWLQITGKCAHSTGVATIGELKYNLYILVI